MLFRQLLAALSLLCVASLLSLSASGSTSATADPGRSGNLVSVDWLKRNLARKDVILLDASAPPLYMKGHIPGAISASILSHGVQEMSPDKMEARYRGYGIKNDSTLVIYEGGDAMWAHHLFYNLYYHGFAPERLLLLDGGLEKWKAEGGEVTTTTPAKPAPGDFRISALREMARVRLPEVLVASGDPSKAKLIEALDPDWHYGDKGFFDRAGHIPNAINLPSKDFFNKDGTFKSPAELKRLFDYLGVKPGQTVYSHCGGGVAAAVPFFALKFILGHDDVKLYRESQVGWLQDDRGLPFWTYAAPQLMRDTTWAKTWGGAMMRMYRNSPIDFIDVRSPEDFKFRHAKFALNVPAAALRPHLNDPAKLAAIFGEAGVKSQHEALVMSERGLTPDAALTWLALERAGQARTAVLPVALEAAAVSGLAMNDAAADAKKAADGKPIAPKAPVATRYAAQPRDSIIVRDAARAQGVYPRVFIAAGKSPPASAPQGTVIHVPWTELVTPEGAPKPAKDIWKVLEKAGLPRYAEIVTLADEPGEAAVNYFVLRLMGFPDVKVWVRG